MKVRRERERQGMLVFHHSYDICYTSIFHINQWLVLTKEDFVNHMKLWSVCYDEAHTMG